MILERRDKNKVVSIAALLWMAFACSKTVGGEATGDGDGDGDGLGGDGGDGDGAQAGDGDGDVSGDGDTSGDGDGDASGDGDTGGTSGDGDTGGMAGDGDGDGSGGTSTGGNDGMGGGPDLPILDDTGLNGEVFDLGDGSVRIVYDFSDDEQLTDWIGVDPNPPNDYSIVNGALLVDSSGQSGLLVVELIRQLSATRIEFDALLEQGNHINAYFDLINTRTWNDGVGIVHRQSGISFIRAGEDTLLTFEPTDVQATPSTTVWGHYVLQRDGGELTVSLDDNSSTVTAGNNFPTTQAVALGSYQSIVSFDNVVIEGELHPQN